MGADGGSIPRREELVRTRARDDAAAEDPALLLRALWTLCALSRLPLAKPIVSDATGQLYNKEAVLRFLLVRADPAAERDAVDEAVAGHLKGLKDVRELTLEPNPAFKRSASTSDHAARSASSKNGGGAADTDESSTAFPFICALTQKTLNGKSRFVYLRSCGCVLAESGLRAVASASSSSAAAPSSSKTSAGKDSAAAAKLNAYECPLCSKSFRASPAFFSNKAAAALALERRAGADGGAGAGASSDPTDVELAMVRYDPAGDVVPLNPPPAEQEALRAAFLANRAAAAAAGAAASSSSSKKRKTIVSSDGVGAAAGDGAAGTEGAGGGADAEKARRKAEAKAARQAAIAKLTAELAEDGMATAPAGPSPIPLAASSGAPAGPPTKRAKVTPAPGGAAPGAAAAPPAKKEEKKEMSAAIRSIYGLDRPKDPKGESWMVRGTFNRYA